MIMLKNKGLKTDLCGTLESTAKGDKMILEIVCWLSNYKTISHNNKKVQKD